MYTIHVETQINVQIANDMPTYVHMYMHVSVFVQPAHGLYCFDKWQRLQVTIATVVMLQVTIAILVMLQVTIATLVMQLNTQANHRAKHYANSRYIYNIYELVVP